MSLHILINNSKGTVKYVSDSTAMLKSELPGKILDYLKTNPKRLHLYTDQIEWLGRIAGKTGSTHSSQRMNSHKQLAHEVLNYFRDNPITVIPIEREA